MSKKGFSLTRMILIPVELYEKLEHCLENPSDFPPDGFNTFFKSKTRSPWTRMNWHSSIPLPQKNQNTSASIISNTSPTSVNTTNSSDSTTSSNNANTLQPAEATMSTSENSVFGTPSENINTPPMTSTPIRSIQKKLQFKTPDRLTESTEGSPTFASTTKKTPVPVVPCLFSPCTQKYRSLKDASHNLTRHINDKHLTEFKKKYSPSSEVKSVVTEYINTFIGEVPDSSFNSPPKQMVTRTQTRNKQQTGRGFPHWIV